MLVSWSSRVTSLRNLKFGFTLATLPRTVNTLSWQCGWDSWPRNVSKVGYAVTLRTCSVRCRYLAVTSKGWYGYGLSRSGRATWHVTAVRSSRLPYIHDASGSRNKLGTPRCNARRILLRHEAWDEISDRNTVSCQATCNVTALRCAVTLQVWAQIKTAAHRVFHIFNIIWCTSDNSPFIHNISCYLRFKLLPKFNIQSAYNLSEDFAKPYFHKNWTLWHNRVKHLAFKGQGSTEQYGTTRSQTRN
jgi:hypothetical protein